MFKSAGMNKNTIGTRNTDGTGYYSYDWDIPAELSEGNYFIKVEFAEDSNYLGRSARTSSENMLFVVSEFQLGTLAAVLPTFGAFAVYKKHKSTKP